MPTLRSEITQPSAKGITTQAIEASTKVTSGAIRNTGLSEPAGITTSFSTNLMKSAKDCSRPHGPTTFGPRRSCTAAQTFRST